MSLCCDMSQPNANDTPSALVELRKGLGDEPIFLFSGGDGNSRGLLPLAAQMRDTRPIIGVDFCRYDARGQLPPDVETMAAHSCSAIRAMQPRGPYVLIGYSFGGLIALEVARLLHDMGEEIALLGLIDTLFDQRFWPTRIFLRSQARLIGRHLAALKQLPLQEMMTTLAIRGRGLFRRLVNRRIPASLVIPKPQSGSTSAVEHHCKVATGKFNPRRFTGRIICFDAENHDDYGCHPTELWRSMGTEVECVTITGTHVGVIQNELSLAALARALETSLNRTPHANSSSR